VLLRRRSRAMAQRTTRSSRAEPLVKCSYPAPMSVVSGRACLASSPPELLLHVLVDHVHRHVTGASINRHACPRDLGELAERPSSANCASSLAVGDRSGGAGRRREKLTS